MLITYLKDTDLLKVEATDIPYFITHISDYTGITLKSTTNCSTTSFSFTYNTTDIINTTSKFYIQSNVLYIKPSFLNLTKFVDGVFTISITFNKQSSSTIIEACTFVDITYKCKVAQYLQKLIDEAKQNNIEKISTAIHLLHYGLVNAGSCDCRCEDMCEAFTHLKELLDNTKTQTLEDCGCQT